MKRNLASYPVPSSNPRIILREADQPHDGPFAEAKRYRPAMPTPPEYLSDARSERIRADAGPDVTDELAFGGPSPSGIAGSCIHCYRMLGSFGGPGGLIQETFLRAWRSRSR